MVRPVTFDPFSIPKYHRVFWDGAVKSKKILTGCLVLTPLWLKTMRFVLDVKTNLILPARFSADRDTMVIAALVYTAFTITVGFGTHRYREELKLKFPPQPSASPA